MAHITLQGNELVVFVDAKPQEAIDPTKDDMLCFTAVAAGFKGAFKYKQFKNTRGRSRKLKTVKNLTDEIRQGYFDIKAISLIGKMNGQYVQWAYSTFNEICEDIDAYWVLKGNKPKRLVWKNKQFEYKHALGLAVYSFILALIGLRFGTFLQNHPKYKTVIFVLDNLPLKSSDGMELMKAISFTTYRSDFWKRNLEHGIDFQITTAITYSNKKVINAPTKNHPVSILADWLGVTTLAKIHPKQIKSESNLTDTDIEYFVELWKVVNSKRKFDLLYFDDPQFLKKIKKKENKKVRKKKINRILRIIKNLCKKLYLKIKSRFGI